MTPLSMWRDAGVGETREALVEDGRAIALSMLRASEHGARARWGETYAARVTRVEKKLRGAFLDLGLSEDVGFLPLDSAGAVHRRDGSRASVKNGQAVVVSVVREAARGKGPVLALTAQPHPGGAPRRLARHETDETLAAHAGADMNVRAALDAAFDEAVETAVAIPGGGALSIEPTAALVAIDIDAAGRAGSSDPEKFALDLNVAAAREIARQVRLRDLGGLIAIDFVSMRQTTSRAALEAAAKQAFAGDPWGVQQTRLSRFGVMELARPQVRTPLHERLRGPETLALKALREIERAGVAEPARRVVATVPHAAIAWLEAARLDWRGGLDARLGPRWEIAAHDGARVDVRTR
ncbi:MAG: hypothetical protein GC206_07045 [Alphaproteobacteria bacterium]|nr:hypothetical protein [Alphaproteobacteria bacterium]